MINVKSIIIIPARGGSKRIPGKNIADLNGDPLIKWAIVSALGNKLVEGVYVSSNDKKIGVTALDSGACLLIRPDDLCKDTSTSEEAIEHALGIIEEHVIPEYIVMMQCTQPFRPWQVIDRAIEKMDRRKADTLYFGYPVGRWIWHPKNYPLNYKLNERTMTQDKKWEMVECSDYIFRRDYFKEHKNRLGGKITRYDIDPVYGLDIDTPYDLKLANAIAKEFGLNADNQSIQKII